MKDLMVDLETFGCGKNAVIVQIGAAYFDRETGEVGDTFKMNVDAESCVSFGGEMDASTVYWWMQQSKDSIDSITQAHKHPLDFTLNEFIKFSNKAKNIWSHATFDFVILQESFRMVGIKGFPYRKARDIRTLMDLSNISKYFPSRSGVHHDALDDCIFQIEYCCKAFKSLEVNNG